MASLLLKNIGTLVTGDLKHPPRTADSLFIEDGVIQEIGNGKKKGEKKGVKSFEEKTGRKKRGQIFC